MKFVDLSRHLRELRYKRNGRNSEAAMTALEVWQGAEQCTCNGISKIFVYFADLPAPFDGCFVRMSHPTDGHIGVIFVRRGNEKHWQEFALIKELMHCWSSKSTWVSTPEEVANLITALNMKPNARYPAVAVADMNAVQAALEVILPHYIVEHHIAIGVDAVELGSRHSIHPDISSMICQHEYLRDRQNGTL